MSNRYSKYLAGLAALSVALIGALGDAFGPAGLEQVLKSRYAKQRSQYAERIPPSLGLAEKVRRLARVRTDEGYMAEVKRDGEAGFILIENHCPICAAAICRPAATASAANAPPRIAAKRRCSG